MGKDSKIEWTDHTFNPWRGCTKVSDGCKFCYAERLAKRNHDMFGIWGDKGTRVPARMAWRDPHKWNRAAVWAEKPARVFCASLADWLEDRTDVDPYRLKLFETMKDTKYLRWLMLTKRPENFTSIMTRVSALATGEVKEWIDGWLSGSAVPTNVAVGVSVENQANTWRVSELQKIPSTIKFLSCEPLLGEVELENTDYINWIIAGGESGETPETCRPMKIEWARKLRDRCIADSIPFLFKQWGEYSSTGQFVNKKDNGRELDGRFWDEIPDGLIK